MDIMYSTLEQVSRGLVHKAWGHLPAKDTPCNIIFGAAERESSAILDGESWHGPIQEQLPLCVCWLLLINGQAKPRLPSPSSMHLGELICVLNTFRNLIKRHFINLLFFHFFERKYIYEHSTLFSSRFSIPDM